MYSDYSSGIYLHSFLCNITSKSKVFDKKKIYYVFSIMKDLLCVKMVIEKTMLNTASHIIQY